MMDRPVIILILAAGASSRMRGADKLLEPVDGAPLLRRSAQVAAATGCAVIVTLPPDHPGRATALAGLAVQALPVPEAATGMSASLRQGVAVAQSLVAHTQAGLMILPADMPDFTTAALGQLIDAFRARPDLIWRGATEAGAPGHPAIFPRDLWPDLARIAGDRGGRSVLLAHPDRLALMRLPGTMALTDLDTPEDWALWRASSAE